MSEEKKVKVRATWTGSTWLVKAEGAPARKQGIALIHGATARIENQKLIVEGAMTASEVTDRSTIDARDLDQVEGLPVQLLIAGEPTGIVRLHLEEDRRASLSGTRFAFTALFLTRIERNTRSKPRYLPHGFGKIAE